MEIQVCIGSACHKRGSYEVKQRLQELVKENNLEDKVEVNSTLCFGECQHSVNVKVGDKLVGGVTPDNAEELFKRYVLSEVK